MTRPNVNVIVGGPKKPTNYAYKTVVLKNNIPFAAQVQEPNCIYVIKWDFDLGEKEIHALDLNVSPTTMMRDCGISVYNGPHAKKTKISGVDYYSAPYMVLAGRTVRINERKKNPGGVVSPFSFLNAEGTEILSDTITVNEDTEIRVGTNDRTYYRYGRDYEAFLQSETIYVTPVEVPAGKRLTVLNTDDLFLVRWHTESLFESWMITGEGSVIADDGPKEVFIATKQAGFYSNAYKIEDVNTVEIPSGCVLKFEGGSINNGVIVGNNTVIDADNVPILSGIHIEGTWSVPDIYSTWIKDCTDVDAIFGLFNMCSDNITNNVYIAKTEKPYALSAPWTISLEPEDKRYIRIVPCANTNIHLNGDIQMIYTLQQGYRMFYIMKDNVTITGPGSISGDTDRISNNGQSGHCIMIGDYAQDSPTVKNVTISGLTLRNAWGDGIYVTGYTESSKNITIRDCTITDCRRQGISLGGAKKVVIENITVRNIDGAIMGPCAAVDIEPDSVNIGAETVHFVVNDICIRNFTVTNCKLGLGFIGTSPNPLENILIDNYNVYRCYERGLRIEYNVKGIKITNSYFESESSTLYSYSQFDASHSYASIEKEDRVVLDNCDFCKLSGYDAESAKYVGLVRHPNIHFNECKFRDNGSPSKFSRFRIYTILNNTGIPINCNIQKCDFDIKYFDIYASKNIVSGSIIKTDYLTIQNEDNTFYNNKVVAPVSSGTYPISIGGYNTVVHDNIFIGRIGIENNSKVRMYNNEIVLLTSEEPTDVQDRKGSPIVVMRQSLISDPDNTILMFYDNHIKCDDTANMTASGGFYIQQLEPPFLLLSRNGFELKNMVGGIVKRYNGTYEDNAIIKDNYAPPIALTPEEEAQHRIIGTLEPEPPQDLDDNEFGYSTHTATANTTGVLSDAPVLANVYELPVSYSSSDPNVATVGTDGVVEVLAAGTAVITASFAGNDTYNPKDTSYNLTVVLE